MHKGFGVVEFGFTLFLLESSFFFICNAVICYWGRIKREVLQLKTILNGNIIALFKSSSNFCGVSTDWDASSNISLGLPISTHLVYLLKQSSI